MHHILAAVKLADSRTLTVALNTTEISWHNSLHKTSPKMNVET
jgi:hypothetical protein